MKKVMRNNQGFSILEVVVVLAVIGALAAMLSPVVFRYIDDANRARTQSDVNTIAAAVQSMYKDTGRWPFYVNGKGALAKAATDADVLTSNPVCDGSNKVTADTTAPTVGSSGLTYATAVCDSLANQLIKNTPSSGAMGTVAYETTGSRAWKGPYLETIPAVDAYGRSFLVSIGNADPAAASPKWVVVVSGGPDGVINTVLTTVATANPAAAGDDIIARVK